MFERLHHQKIALVLSALNGALLRRHQCWFGGGTAIALRYGEYRESVDIDMLVSDADGYRNLRLLLGSPQGIAAITAEGREALTQATELRMDQYGIRTTLVMDGTPIKFEIVREGRIAFEQPRVKDAVCGIATLTPLDLAASKLLANSDRWRDDSVFSRDVIDLAMMKAPLPMLRQAVAKAEGAYGTSILQDLGKAIDQLRHRADRLERCMQALAVGAPKALLWQRMRALERVIPNSQAAALSS